MPSRMARPCRKAGCGRLTRDKSGYCELHMDEVAKQHAEYRAKRTDGSVTNFYGTQAWKTRRAEKLQRNPVCENCMKRKATMVDHVREIKDGGDPLAWENLRSLCYGCHQRKTKREAAKRNG